jgi:2-dehydropantoate 2-reductase
MQITIVGAGAIGGTVGAYLVRDGHDVLFVDTAADHVATINARGLTIRSWAEEFTVPVPAVEPTQLQGPLGLVLLAVKAQHTTTALQTVAPLLAHDGMVVSLQNGLNEQTIAATVGTARTVGCLVNFSADYLEPGLIHYGGPGALTLGELDGSLTPRLDMLRGILSAWGGVALTQNIWGYLWGKLGYANMLFATALADASMAEAIDRYRPVMIELAAEVYEVADQLGIRPEPFDAVEPSLYYPRVGRDEAAVSQALDALVERRKRDQKQRSGIWRDIMVRRRRSEIDNQLVPVLLHGESLGLAMPLTHLVVERIHALEQGLIAPSWSHLDALEQLRSNQPRTEA